MRVQQNEIATFLSMDSRFQMISNTLLPTTETWSGYWLCGPQKKESAIGSTQNQLSTTIALKALNRTAITSIS